MKKISILVITFILVALTLCACGRRKNNNATNPTMNPTQQTTPTNRNTQPSTTNTHPSTAATQPSTAMTQPTDGGSIPGDAGSTAGTGVLDPSYDNSTGSAEAGGNGRGIS